ncbi:MAG: hypothetical protein JXM70_05410 [Pirellulales bacterium]|nr:hypothetical protein [Pirellulales bacterium]
MFRKAFLSIALTAFCIATVIGCAKPASKSKPAEKPAATSEKAPAEKPPAEKAPAEKVDDAKKAEPEKKADAKPILNPAEQAPPSVSE